MNTRSLLTLLRAPNALRLVRLASDWQAFVRIHFLYAALESGLLNALDTEPTCEELLGKLGVDRPEILEALLELGLSLRELACEKGRYRVKGRRSRSLLACDGDPLRAMVQANVTYYNSVYRDAAARMRGAPLGAHLDEIGGVVARCAQFAEPFVRGFIEVTVSGKPSLRILEVGCGSGVFLRCAREANPRATGIGLDLDEEVVAQARWNLAEWGLADRFRVMAGDIRVPPPEVQGPYDLITLYNVVYYFTSDERVGLFRSLRPLLSPGGTLAIVSGFRNGGRDLWTANLNMATSSIQGCSPLPDLDETVAQLRDAGLAQVETTRLVPRSAFFGIAAS